jgi:purine-binding chemotaxis protein CheW
MVGADTIEPTPDVAAGDDATYLRGIAKLGDRLIILLRLDGLFAAEEAAAIAATAA